MTVFVRGTGAGNMMDMLHGDQRTRCGFLAPTVGNLRADRATRRQPVAGVGGRAARRRPSPLDFGEGKARLSSLARRLL